MTKNNIAAMKKEAQTLVRQCYQWDENHCNYQYYLNQRKNIHQQFSFVLQVVKKNQEKSKDQDYIVLLLQHNSLSLRGALVLAKAHITNLKVINLISNSLGDEGCSYLVHAMWPNLTHIRLDWNKIQEKGCTHLAKADWPMLVWMNVCNNPIKFKGYQWLKNKFTEKKVFCDSEYKTEQ